ncbi:MAG TPA: tetratricopeptide repeat protein [Acidimicrobiales bacterium]|nr:tetratricopeptide repeat protein [Acidimicrobiales bacterium]
MTDRLLIDHGLDGRVSVSAWLDGELAPGPASQRFQLSWPLGDEELEDLRWYLEDYLRVPFGVYSDRGARVGDRLRTWGESIFSALFPSGPAREAYVRVRERNPGAEVVLRSSSPAVLGLPWELMTDPGRPTPVTLDGLTVTRSLPTEGLKAAFAAAGERLRVLMVIARPRGAGDVGYRMIARPLLERLDAVRGRVELTVLRPPTLEALERTLADAKVAGQPFQLVHFDGHGVLAGGSRLAGAAAPLAYHQPGSEGVLFFEKPGGGSDQVPAAVFAQLVSDAEVPLVVLNACQSGAVGTEIEAAVATRLLQEGAASVVAMGYSVYALAAADFMAAFYERLFAGDTVSQAVGAGRRRLYHRPERPSSKGMLPLADWIVPVHYLRRDVSFPELRAGGPLEVSLDDALHRLREGSVKRPGLGLESVGTFVGRDGLFYELEVAARLNRVVVLHGSGGTGKTELAKAFGRWWRDTGGVERPEWVILHSFEPGVASFGLDGVLADVGLQVYGADFARLEADERRAVIEGLLVDHRLLLIWDNFESVYSMPDATGATPPLDESGRRKLRAFLGRIADGSSSSLILTSRSEENWLGGIHRIRVGGLAPHEAIEYAEQLLAPYSAATPRRAKQAFGELLQWLDGHPLSMRLVLPHLQEREPEVLLAALTGIGEFPGGAQGQQGRTTSLPASVAYSFAHLGPSSRRLLVALCLIHGVADVNVLSTFSQLEGVPESFAGASRQEWADALDEAAQVGLLTPIDANMYRIHPALPAYLAALWRSEDPEHHDARRDAAARVLLVAYAQFSRWLSQQFAGGDAPLALTLIEQQHRMLGHLLRYALEFRMWPEAEMIARALDPYWHTRGLSEEARGWVDRVRVATEYNDGSPPGLDTSAGSLWLYSVGIQAGHQILSGQLDAAESTYRQLLAMLEHQPASLLREQRLAVTYGQLGLVAQDRGRLDEAEQWYRRCLEIEEELRDRPGTAKTYHHLGMVAHHRGRLDEAEQWYRRGLGILEGLGDRPGTAVTYHQLGLVAQDRGHLDEAEQWYGRCLGIADDLGDRPGMAKAYHQLGDVAHHRGRLDEAEQWYRRCLEIEAELRDRPGLAKTYHHLGRVAESRGRLDEAEQWYRRSLEIKEELDNRPGMAVTYGQFALVAEARQRPEEALEAVVRCVALFDEFPHPATGAGPTHLARLTAVLGMDQLAATWARLTGRQLPHAIVEFVTSQHEGQGLDG